MFPYTAGEFVRESFKPLPEGNYVVKIFTAKQIKNKIGSADGIGITFTVTDGEYIGRLIFDTFYIVHINKVFEKKERNRFNGLLNAIGKEVIYSATEIENSHLTIRVKINPASSDGNFPEKNIVRDYFNAGHQLSGEYAQQERNNDIPF